MFDASMTSVGPAKRKRSPARKPKAAAATKDKRDELLNDLSCDLSRLGSLLKVIEVELMTVPSDMLAAGDYTISNIADLAYLAARRLEAIEADLDGRLI